MPNNRELAMLAWLCALLLWALWSKSVRKQLPSLLRVLVSRKMLIPLSLLLLWIYVELSLGYQLGWLRFDLATDVGFWIAISAVALFFSVKKISTEDHFVRRQVLGVFGTMELFQFVTNLFVMGLVAEMILVPVATLLVVLSAVAAKKREHHAVHKLAQGTLSLLGLFLLVFTLVQAIIQWGGMDWLGVLRKFVLPLWLTIGLLPFLYVLGLWMNYDRAFAGVNWATTGRGNWTVKLALVRTLHFRTREVAAFNWSRAAVLAKSDSYGTARRAVGGFLRDRVEERKRSREEATRLKRFAGVDGVDADGRRLDRREFKETIRALRWLADYQEAWYQNPEHEYRLDLIEFIDLNSTRHGLPADSEIEAHVAEDGQAWYAWRRTVTGWCFAIGAVGPPPGNWGYDGPGPPCGYPGEDPGWFKISFTGEAGVNWDA